ncbi:hypothetical protein HHL11_04850 [Ramlibacter sp. G-1-2-2]|uniref:DUF4148 domain-containing protein n=1 Tax=Ramlibacter agri TaxID=2728837 RepID=A0A848H5T8_9BURK|nr:hypothetical protein [Ramlibacter agri]NML43068.1 hypothetical protein [Ramlibacter agri]
MSKKLLALAAAALCATGAMAHESAVRYLTQNYERACPVGYVQQRYQCVPVAAIDSNGYSASDYRRYERLQRRNVSPEDYRAHLAMQQLQQLQNPGANP